MTRYSNEHKEVTRTRILLESEAIWKSEGLTAATVERIMGEAGLTVGGFYGHFKSKESLLSETLKYSLRQGYRRLFGGIKAKSKHDWLVQVVKRYLSQVSHTDLRTACPLPLLTPEMARSSPKMKRAFSDELSTLLDGVLDQVPGETSSAKKTRILAVLSCCVGAVAMARALGDSPQSKEMIDEVESLLTKRGVK